MPSGSVKEDTSRWAPGSWAKVHARPLCGHNGPVKFRVGTAIAFCIGYALGSRAGRERYEQLVRSRRQGSAGRRR